MFLLILVVDQNAINEYHDNLVQFQHEHRIHQVHEIYGSIGKPKRHDQIHMKIVSSGECHFGNIYHTRFCEQNQVLIVYVPRIIYSTHTDIKCSQIVKYHK
jgi:hypothetical protein